jgi:hypothetical protein
MNRAAISQATTPKADADSAFDRERPGEGGGARVAVFTELMRASCSKCYTEAHCSGRYKVE